ncbi:MAG: YdeI/OmpD-associated family protein [Bacteroidota bacterium]
MPTFSFSQALGQLEKRKGGYYYFRIDASVVDQFERKRSTRLVCEVEGKVSYSCGLNHLGDGNYFIILSNKNREKAGITLGDEVHFSIKEDPNPLGVAVPEVLDVLLQQDPEAKQIYDQITDGKKRSLIYTIMKIKDIDKQIQTTLDFLQAEYRKIQQKQQKKKSA